MFFAACSIFKHLNLLLSSRTKRRVDEVTEGLKRRMVTWRKASMAICLQQKRDSVFVQFREGTIDILVATDVAARGLDISGVSHAI